MASRKLARSFTIAQWTFKPAPTATTEKRRRVHRLRLPLRFEGKDPAEVLNFATKVRGEDLQALIDLKDGQPPVEVVARLEAAGVKLSKGKKTAPVSLALVVESEAVAPIEAVLGAAVRAARAELPEVSVTLEPIQGELPGMEEDQSEDPEPEGEGDAEGAPEDERAAGEVLDGPGSKRGRGRGKRRRPKGSSPSP